MRRPAWLPLLLPVSVTVLVAWAFRAADTQAPASAAARVGLLLVMPLPLLVSVAWGWIVLRAGSLSAVLVAALIAGALTVAVVPGQMLWQIAANAAAGVIAGLAWQRYWRPDAALVLCTAALLPVIVWTVLEVPVAEQLDLIRQDMLEILEDRMPPQAAETERAKALETERRRLDQVLAFAGRIYPLVIAVGLLAQATIILALTWVAGRLSGMRLLVRRFGPFSQVRLPFYLVWLLVIGIGLMLTRSRPAADWGLNLALLAALVLSVQGLAVQVFVIGRMLSPLGRLMFWTVMGVFFAPLVIVSGTVLGLADQWLDFRGQDRPGDDEDEKVV